LTAPVLDPSVSPILPTVLQGAVNPAGVTIAELVVDGSITDPDGEAVEAIAITGLNTDLGAWQYSLDDGATWFTIDADRINSEVNELALHLGPTAKLRLLPFASLHGTLEDAVTFRAWDQSSGSADREGKYLVVPVAGDAPDSSGTPSAYSQDTDTASITVEPNGELPDPVTTNRGTLLTDIDAGSYDFATSITTQADGKILVAGVGASQFAILRYNIDGSLDTTFNGTGLLAPEFGSNDWAWEVTVQADGKIVVAGTTVTSTVIARYNADGTADTSFNGSGHVVNTGVGFGNSLALQTDGSMVVAGLSYSTSFDIAVGRFTADGALDPSFNGTGVVTTDVAGSSDFSRDMQVQADGKIVVLAKMEPSSDGHLGLVRYNPDGSLDTTFNGSGALLTELQATDFTGGSVSIQADGKILVAAMDATRGLVDSDFALARFNADGSVDTSFGVNGKVVTDLGANRQDIVGRATLQADGKILVAGSTDVSGMDWDFALVRYNADGSLDTTFNGTGQARADIGEHSTDFAYALTVQADGKVLVTGASSANGSSDFAVARFNADGSLDESFGDGDPPGETEDGTPVRLDTSLAGTPGPDTLTSFGGDDTLNGGGGNDVLDGGEGSDLYVISAATEHTVAEIADTGTAGTDEVRFAATATSTLILFAGDAGIERVVIGTGAGDAAIASATTGLNVNASAAGNALWIAGNAGANTLMGSAFNDTLDGGAGADKLAGGNGDDAYTVDDSKDLVIEGNAAGGTDRVEASISYTLPANVEHLALTGEGAIDGTGNVLANVINGNSATNVLDGKAGLDSLDGGEGSDLYVVGLASDHPSAEIADSGTGGTDEIRFAATKAGTLTLFAGDTGIERIVIGTGTGATAVTKGTAALNVNATAVTNGLSITGNAGANVLTGTAYGDTLAGGNGNDVLTGGSGADSFAFNFAVSASKNRDTITDFQSGTDMLELSKAVFSSLAGAIGTLSADQFWSGAGITSAHDADDRIVYNTATGALYYDADGNGNGKAAQIALIGTTTHPELAFSDIHLIA
jgi:uncharacterized delta-60 repeat protein